MQEDLLNRKNVFVENWGVALFQYNNKVVPVEWLIVNQVERLQMGILLLVNRMRNV